MNGNREQEGGSSGESKTKIRTLLELLDNVGAMDAKELEQRTGFARAVIVATMYCAKARGMVEFKPAKEATPTSEQSGSIRRTRRGQSYAFVSYQSIPKEDREVADVDPWPKEVKQYYDDHCTRGAREALKVLEASYTSRRHHLMG